MTRLGQFCDLGTVSDDRSIDVEFAEKVLRLRTILRDDGAGWQEFDQTDGISRELGRYSTDLVAAIDGLGRSRWAWGDIRSFRLDQQWLLSHYTSTATIVYGGYREDKSCTYAVRGSRIRQADLAQALCRAAIEARDRENKDVPRACSPMADGQELPVHST